MAIRRAPKTVETYLAAHVDALFASASAGTISAAVFRSTEGRTRFGDLVSGTREDFLAASQELADRLHQRMDQRTKRGFFVTLRRGRAATEAAVLKLDVTAEAAAAITHDDKGRPLLEGVEDLLDIPGDLQKGAVVPDARSGSDVVVGDKLAITSLYFLDAVDVEQQAAAGPAAVDLLRIVQEVAPGKADAVAQALESGPRATVSQFFAARADLLDAAEVADVIGRARTRRRPVVEVDPTAHVVRETIEADGITVRGRASTIREKVRVTQRPGGYRIEIDTIEEPRRRFD